MLQGKLKTTEAKKAKVHIHDYRNLDIVKQVLETFKKQNRRVLVYYDPDVDGMVAGRLASEALDYLGIEFSYYINSNRNHGFFIDPDKLHNINIFAVDFMFQPEILKQLVNQGCNIISMDHHEPHGEAIYYGPNGEIAVVINNQWEYEAEDGRYLSGAGVVFEGMVKVLGEEYNTKTRKALVGLTLLTDVRDIEAPLARGYLEALYNHKYAGYIKYLIDGVMGDKDYMFGLPKMDRSFISYTFSPAINSNLRFNKEEDVVRFFNGYGVLDLSYHTKQKEVVKGLRNIAELKVYDHLYLVEIPFERLPEVKYSDFVSNFIGLVANTYLDGTHSVITFVNNADGTLNRGSFRGRYVGVDYLKALNDSNLLLGMGHGSAFGIKDLSREYLDISNLCGVVEEGSLDTHDKLFESTKNLGSFKNLKAKSVAYENQFKLDENQVYVKYTGDNISCIRDSEKYQEYLIDGVSVKAFNRDLHPSRNLIKPTLERGYLNFYLESN